jgi:hypothetical protein
MSKIDRISGHFLLHCRQLLNNPGNFCTECRAGIWLQPRCGDDGKEGTLYGLKSSGLSWKTMLTQNLMEMGYKSTIPDLDVFIRPAVKPDGFEYL